MAERLTDDWQTALRGPLEVFDLPHPAGQWVPSRENLGHQPQPVDSKEPISRTHTVVRTGTCSALSPIREEHAWKAKRAIAKTRSDVPQRPRDQRLDPPT